MAALRVTQGLTLGLRKDKTHLVAALRRLGWSQAELARRIGRHPVYLNQVLNGKAISTIVWVEAWAAIHAAEAGTDSATGAPPDGARD